MQKDFENEIRTNISAIAALEKSMPKAVINPQERKRGLEISKLATSHPGEVAMTPIMKNMLHAFGDIGEGEKLKTGAPETRAEKWLAQTVEQLLLKQTKQKLDSYNTSLSLTDVRHYDVDCWLNYNPKKFRDIQPGQVEEINEMVTAYAKPTSAMDLLAMGGQQLLKACELVCDELPRVSATKQIVPINLPFMTKHTNVGYPYFSNDRTTVPGTNLTYAQLTMQEAERASKLPDDQLWKWLCKNNVSTEFARFQKGKGRLIIAVSRLVNLVLNQLEAVEIQNYKTKSSLFAGYNDASYLKAILKEMTQFSQSHGYGMYNIDYHRYDKHVNKAWIELFGAMSMYKCADARSKTLAKFRAALMTDTQLVCGSMGRILEIFGRIFSGYIDTNRGGGGINGTNMTNLLMSQSDHFVRDIVTQVAHWMLVMGDDNLCITPIGFSLPRLQKDAEKYGFEIDDTSKIAFGPKFLQYRLFEYHGKEIMIYPWTRVLNSMLMKERQTGLGPCGWTLALYQQAAKLMEGPEYLANVVNIIAYFDDNHLMLDRSIDDIIKGASQEDAEAAQGPKASRRESTANRLYDGDPSKAEQFDPEGNLKPNYFREVQAAIKSVYDPSFFSKNGISVPKR